MDLPHLEWLLGEPVDSELICYEALPYSPADADQIIQHLFALAHFDLGEARSDSARTDRIRQAFRIIIDAALELKAVRNLAEFNRQISKSPWRGLVRNLRNGRTKFATVIGDKNARACLRWALIDLGLAPRAGRHWLHYLRDHPNVLRKTIIRALETPVLQNEVGRPDRFDLTLVVEGVNRAYKLLTRKRLGRNVTSDTKTRPGGTPTGPGFQLASICLKSLDGNITDHAVVWAIRRVQARSGAKLLG